MLGWLGPASGRDLSPLRGFELLVDAGSEYTALLVLFGQVSVSVLLLERLVSELCSTFVATWGNPCALSLFNAPLLSLLVSLYHHFLVFLDSLSRLLVILDGSCNEGPRLGFHSVAHALFFLRLRISSVSLRGWLLELHVELSGLLAIN